MIAQHHTAPFPFLSQVVETLASTQPDGVFAKFPHTSDLQDWQDVTWKDLAAGVNRLSWWIKEKCGARTTSKFSERPVIAYVGPTDIRYAIVMLACMKTGYSVMLTSPRNSNEAHIALCQATKCESILYAEEMSGLAANIVAAHESLTTLQIPNVGELLGHIGSLSSDHYAGLVRDADRDECLLVLHTSGSTGLPKPIYVTNEYIWTIYRSAFAKTPAERKLTCHGLFHASRVLATTPFFHMMGNFALVGAIMFPHTLILLPSDKLPNPDLITDVVLKTNPGCLFSVPVILEGMCKTEKGRKALSTIATITYAGAPLNNATATILSQLGTEASTAYGTTETGWILAAVPEDPLDRNYLEFWPGSGIEMQPAGDDLFEATIQRLDDIGMQASFRTFPEAKEYRTKDLFERHPDPAKTGLWKYKGRNDDVLVLSNGEKFNPIDFEQSIEQHPGINGALIIGQARFQASLIIEPASTTPVSTREETEDLVDAIWPLVEQANRIAPKHAQIYKSKIAVASPSKPFKRSPKGNIVRRATVDMYEVEINALYSNEGVMKQIGTLTATDRRSIVAFLRKAVAVTMPGFPVDGGNDADFFAHGADSLQVLALLNVLTNALPNGNEILGGTFPLRLIYDNSTIASLAKALQEKIEGEDADSGIDVQSREDQMADLIAKYTTDLPVAPTNRDKPAESVVALTGSTGSLGSYILETLISNPNVSKIYCLNRSVDAASRQATIFSERSTSLDLSRVEFLHADLGADAFGLSPEKYKELQVSVTCSIHNAWTVDFNMSLPLFAKTHIAGVRHCIDFSAAARYTPEIVFISSVAAVGNYVSSSSKAVPEIHFEDHSVPLPQGYGEAKHVAECIFAAGADKAGVPSTVIRCGQLAGPDAIKGMWNRQEWMPALIATSVAMGKIPRSLDSFDDVDWVPMNHAAQAVCDIALRESKMVISAEAEVFHITNPRVSAWQDIVSEIQDFYAGETKLQIVEFAEWVAELQQAPRTVDEVEKKPALKLLEFYKSLVDDSGGRGRAHLATDRAVIASKTLREMKPVGRDLMRKWLEQWQFR